MALVVDANRCGDFSRPMTGHAGEILRCIGSGQNKLVLGGRLRKELGRTNLGTMIVELMRSGKIHSVDDGTVDSMEAKISPSLTSDDPHIVALVLVSGARLVYTEDNALISDLKNKKIVRPKGKIIRRTTPVRQACALLRLHSDL